MYMQWTPSRRAFWIGLLFVLSCAALIPISASAQGACTTPDQLSGDHCRQPIPTPWHWGSDWNISPREYATLDQLIAAMSAHMLAVPGPQHCSFTLDSVSYDVGAIGYAWPGAPQTDISHDHTGHFTDIWTNVAPCDITSHGDIGLYQHRTFTCPTDYTLGYDPAVGPYCALAWWKPDPQKSAGQCKKGQLLVGHPCEIGSRNKYLKQADYTGSGTPSLAIERHYNSLNIVNYTSVPFSYEPFGPGWSAKYFQRLEYLSAGGPASVDAYRPDGQRLAFVASGSSFIAAPDVDERLTAQRDASNNIVGWTLTTPNDAVETYDASGKLQSIVERGGSTATLHYDAGGTLQAIEDAFGHQLTVTFSEGHVTQIADAAGVSIDYGYDAGKLATVTYQDDTTRRYHYDGYYLTGVTDESAVRYSTYTYDSGWGTLSTTELAGGVSKYTITGDTFNRYVTDPLGKQRTYGFGPTAQHHIYRMTGSTAVSDSPRAAKRQFSAAES